MNEVGFGLNHKSWREPACFFYPTEAAAWAASAKTYGPASTHTVVKRTLEHFLTRPEADDE